MYQLLYLGQNSPKMTTPPLPENCVELKSSTEEELPGF